MKLLVLLLGCGAIVLMLTGVVAWAPAYYTGTHTEFCPLAHKVAEGAQCVVLDREPARTLVQHANTETGERYLEIASATASRLYEIPVAAKGLAPEGYTAKLLEGETEWVQIDERWESLHARR